MEVQAYLFFDGRCEEALDFYKTALGADITALIRFKDSPMAAQPGMMPPGADSKIIHASFRLGETTVLASDGRCLGKPHFEGMALTLTFPGEAEAERAFAALAEGGQVQMPMAPNFFAGRFGMAADKFGVNWMVQGAPLPPN